MLDVEHEVRRVAQLDGAHREAAGVLLLRRERKRGPVLARLLAVLLLAGRQPDSREQQFGRRRRAAQLARRLLHGTVNREVLRVGSALESRQ